MALGRPTFSWDKRSTEVISKGEEWDGSPVDQALEETPVNAIKFKSAQIKLESKPDLLFLGHMSIYFEQ